MRLSDAQREEIRRLYFEGHPRPSYSELALQFGVSKQTIAITINPARQAEWKHASEVRARTAAEAQGPLRNDDLKHRLSLIPPDTRDFTARFFGDPPPGRSALDQRRQGRAG